MVILTTRVTNSVNDSEVVNTYLVTTKEQETEITEKALKEVEEWNRIGPSGGYMSRRYIDIEVKEAENCLVEDLMGLKVTDFAKVMDYINSK